jgi:GTPase involved in cell partitioning and DNA repair
LRARGSPEVKVDQLTSSDRREIVTQSLANYNKKLEEQQTQILLNKKDAVNPLYLVIACEELRIFGIYEKLTEKVRQIADTTPALIEQVLERLETEHGRDLVKKSLSLIQCARNGNWLFFCC